MQCLHVLLEVILGILKDQHHLAWLAKDVEQLHDIWMGKFLSQAHFFHGNRHGQRRKIRTRPPPKKIFRGTFLASKKNIPGRWWMQKPYKNQKNHIYRCKSFLCGPHVFWQRKVLHWSRAVYAFFFPDGGARIGGEKCARTSSAQTFIWTPPGVRDIPAKFPGHPRFFPSKPKENKLSRKGTNFSTTTPSRGRPPPRRAVSGPQKLIFVLFFLAWAKGAEKASCGETVVQKGFLKSPFPLCPLKAFKCWKRKP